MTMNRPVTPDEVARLTAARRELGEQELEGMKNRLSAKNAGLDEAERAELIENLRSNPPS
jgi:hypothetical protein